MRPARLVGPCKVGGELNVVVIDVDTHLESGPQLAAKFCDAVGDDLTAGEFMHRTVRATPLASQGDDALALLGQIPDMMVFSSDFPHPEGDDVIFDPGLDHLDVRMRASFLGDNIAACFERVGDPLPTAASR